MFRETGEMSKSVSVLRMALCVYGCVCVRKAISLSFCQRQGENSTVLM